MAADLRITAVTATPLWLPFTEPYHWAGRVDHGAAVVLVEVQTDAGITGVGESTAASPADGTVAALRGVAPLFVGEPVHDVDRLITRARFLGSFNWTPWQANLVLAGLEMALWDAIGKAAGQPVHRLLGGQVRDEVDYFGFPQGDTAERAGGSTPRTLAEAGHGVIYLKVGRGERDRPREHGGRARRHRRPPPAPGSPTAPGASPEAIHMIGRLAAFEPEWIEQPTTPPSVAALRHVKEAVSVPIAADQAVFTPADVYELCRQRAVDVVVLSLHEAGGLLAFVKAAADRRGRRRARLPARPVGEQHHRCRPAPPGPAHAPTSPRATRSCTS